MDDDNRIKGGLVFASITVGIICPLILAIIEIFISFLPLFKDIVDSSWYVRVVFFVIPFYVTYVIIRKAICKNNDLSHELSMFVLGIIYMCFAFIYLFSAISLMLLGKAQIDTYTIISISIVVIIAGFVFLMHGIDAVKKH